MRDWLHCSGCMRPIVGCKKRPEWSGKRGCVDEGLVTL